MSHFVTSCMNQIMNRKQTLESAQYGLGIIFKGQKVSRCTGFPIKILIIIKHFGSLYVS